MRLHRTTWALVALCASVLGAGAPARAACSGPAVPFEIISGPDGNLWFTEIAANKLVAMDLSGRVVKEASIPTLASGPAGIAPGRMNDIWFTEAAAGNIARYDIATGKFSEYPVPDGSHRLPKTLTLGPDGNMWFTLDNIGGVGRVTYDGHVTLFAIPFSPRTISIVTGPDGALWFANGAGSIDRITTSGELTQFHIDESGSGGPRGLVVGSDGELWFTIDNLFFGDEYIGHMRTDGTRTMYRIPNSKAWANNITEDRVGNFWFTETSGMKIGRMTPNGQLAEYPIPSLLSAPIGIATAADGAMWFTEPAVDKIGRITTTGEIAEFPVSDCARLVRSP
jgi:streptogramin lyase